MSEGYYLNYYHPDSGKSNWMYFRPNYYRYNCYAWHVNLKKKSNNDAL